LATLYATVWRWSPPSGVREVQKAGDRPRIVEVGAVSSRPHAARFRELAAHRCPAPGELALALAAEFGRFDPAAGALLDDGARRLFGVAELEPMGQAERLAVVMDCELGLGVSDDYGPEAVLLDRVLESLRGHPLLLAVVGRELAVRAGASAAVFVSRTRWFVGLTGGPQPVMLDARLNPAIDRAPASVRGLCAHEVAYCVLTRLEQRLIACECLFEARKANRLRDALPVGTAGHDRSGKRASDYRGDDGLQLS